MSRTYRRRHGAAHLRQEVIHIALGQRPEAWTGYRTERERRADPNAPDLVAAVGRLQQDRREHRYANPPWAHRQVQNRRDRYAMAHDLAQWHPERDDPAHRRHRHSEQRAWDWW